MVSGEVLDFMGYSWSKLPTLRLKTSKLDGKFHLTIASLTDKKSDDTDFLIANDTIRFTK